MRQAGGRYLSDTWVLDLDGMSWAPGPTSTRGAQPPPPSDGPAEPPPPLPPAMPPTAGHALVPWQGSLLSIGGHIKVLTRRDHAGVHGRCHHIVTGRENWLRGGSMHSRCTS